MQFLVSRVMTGIPQSFDISAHVTSLFSDFSNHTSESAARQSRAASALEAPLTGFRVPRAPACE
jgi:hypothetical protein